MTGPTRPDWDTYFLGIAQAVALRADCRRRKVGAILVDQHRRIVATGYNGGPPKGPSCLAGQCPRGMLSYQQQPADVGYDSCIALHAEHNVLIYSSPEQQRGATLYITHKPCLTCHKLLTGTGIGRVVWDQKNVAPPG